MLLLSSARKFVLPRPGVNQANMRYIANLPEYDEAAKIGLKTLWPAVMVLIGLQSLAFYVSPFRTSSMDAQKWKNTE